MPIGIRAVKPPLGKREDAEALWANLSIIDCFASDHGNYFQYLFYRLHFYCLISSPAYIRRKEQRKSTTRLSRIRNHASIVA